MLNDRVRGMMIGMSVGVLPGSVLGAGEARSPNVRGDVGFRGGWLWIDHTSITSQFRVKR